MKIGIALGSGSARGWAHFGVFERLAELGIKPHVVTGASAGALVGAAYASHRLPELKQWACGLTRRDIFSLIDAALGNKGGIMKGDRLMNAINEQVPDCDIESLDIPFASVAADLASGMEVWFKEGSLHQAIRASSGFPGLFTPLLHDERWLIDGGVVNPVPVSLCKAMGAEFVIAVNLNRHLNQSIRTRYGRHQQARKEREQDKSVFQFDNDPDHPELIRKWTAMFNGFLSSRHDEQSKEEPKMTEVMTATINIMQNMITRSRMAGDPPNATITPNLADFQMMDFHRADEAIEEGINAVNRSLPELETIT